MSVCLHLAAAGGDSVGRLVGRLHSTQLSIGAMHKGAHSMQQRSSTGERRA